MKMTPPSLLAILTACAIPARSSADSLPEGHAYAYDHGHDPSGLICKADIPDLPDVIDPPEPATASDPLASTLPPTEIYVEGVEYPGTVRDRAVKWAKIFEVPPSWLIPLGYVESKNQPAAQNKSGATGALQIKLARARDLVTWMNRSKWKAHQEVQAILSMFWHGLRNDLLNLDLNIMLAAFELHHLRRRFGNDREIVHAAYNQGEGRISRCLARGLPLPARAREFISRIGMARQRGYV